MNTNQMLVARSLATPVTHVQAAADKSPWMQVQYVPALGASSTSASVAFVQASSMTFLADSAVPAGLDAIGASGVLLTSSSAYDTMGELVDAINGVAAWRAYLIGCLRADLTSNLLAKSATICSGANGLTFYGDTTVNAGAIIPGTAGAYEQVSVAISGEKFVNNGVNGHVTDEDDACENSLLLAQVQLSFTGDSDTLSIYSAPQKSVETRVLDQDITSTTLIELGRTGSATVLDGHGSIFMTAKRGERLIIRAAAETAFSAYTKFNITGKTAVLSGSRMVDEINYTA